MSMAVPHSPFPQPSVARLWAWTNPACGLFEFSSLSDLSSAAASGRIPPETLVWRNSPGCQSIPARFLSVPWTLHLPGGRPSEKISFEALQERYFAGSLPPGSKLGQQGNLEPETIFGPRR